MPQKRIFSSKILIGQLIFCVFDMKIHLVWFQTRQPTDKTLLGGPKPLKSMSSKYCAVTLYQVAPDAIKNYIASVVPLKLNAKRSSNLNS